MSLPHRPRRAAIVFVFITVALDILAIGVVIPVLPHLIEAFAGGDTASAAHWLGVFGTAFALVQFLCAPLLGALSDRFGRRPVILLSNLGLGLDFVLMAMAHTLPLLFLGRVLAGLTSASVATANAYIADVTPPDRRAAGFGLLGAAFGLGFVLGPALGGVLGDIDLRLPFWVAAGLSLANFLYGFFILPESLPPSARSALDLRRANPLGALLLLRRYRRVLGLAAVLFLSNLAHYVLPACYVLYTAHRYGWGAKTVGLALAAVGVCTAIVQALLVRRIVPALGERRALLLGLSCGVAGFAIQGLAPTAGWFLLAIPVMAFWGLAGPSAQTLMTRQVDPHEQGRLQGALTSLTSLAGVFGPAMFTTVFALALVPWGGFEVSGAPFVLAALLLSGAAALALRVTR